MSVLSARMTCLRLALLLAVAVVSTPLRAQTPPSPDIDLKLFEKSEVDRSKGCSVGLWQANRDPEKDRFAYIFLETLTGKNNARQPARMKIGAEVVTLKRVATGGKNNGYDLFEYQQYKLPGADDFVVVELKLGPLEGEAVDVESGTLSIIMRGKSVFRASVKGGAGCMTPAAPAAPPAASIPKAAAPVKATPAPAASSGDHNGLFERYAVNPKLVAPELKQAAKKKFGCEDRMMNSGVIGYSLSEEAAIWQIPCESFAYQSSSVFAKVYTPAPGMEHEFLTFTGPKGVQRTNEPNILLNATVDARTKTVQSVSLGRSMGDCGVLERYRVTAEGGFRLLEYREKKDCDGKMVKPEAFPLVFKAP